MDPRLGSPIHLRTLLVALIGCLAVGGVLAWAPSRLLASDPVPESRRADTAAEQLSRQMEAHLLDRFEAINALTHPSVLDELSTAARFEAAVLPVLDTFPELRALNRIDRGHVIRWVVPRAGNEAAHDADLSLHPLAGPVLRTATETANPQVTAPLRLLQGGRGIAAYFPIYDDTGTLDGFLNAVFRLDALVESGISVRATDAFDIVIRDGDEIVYQSDVRAAAHAPDATADITLLSRLWTLDLHLK